MKEEIFLSPAGYQAVIRHSARLWDIGYSQNPAEEIWDEIWQQKYLDSVVGYHPPKMTVSFTSH